MDRVRVNNCTVPGGDDAESCSLAVYNPESSGAVAVAAILVGVRDCLAEASRPITSTLSPRLSRG